MLESNNHGTKLYIINIELQHDIVPLTFKSAFFLANKKKIVNTFKTLETLSPLLNFLLAIRETMTRLFLSLGTAPNYLYAV